MSGRFAGWRPALSAGGFRGIAEALAPEGRLFATFREGPPDPEGSGWLYPEMVPYSWERMNDLVERSGLAARQSWFVAARPDAEREIDDLSHRLRRPLPNPGTGTG